MPELRRLGSLLPAYDYAYAYDYDALQSRLDFHRAGLYDVSDWP